MNAARQTSRVRKALPAKLWIKSALYDPQKQTEYLPNFNEKAPPSEHFSGSRYKPKCRIIDAEMRAAVLGAEFFSQS